MQLIAFLKYNLKNENKIMFALEKLVVKHPEYIFCDTFAHVFFVEEENCFLLTVNNVYAELLSLVRVLRKASKNELIFDENINKDLGFLYNEYVQHELIIQFYFKQYCVWPPVTRKGNIGTWLYNDTLGNITIFLAPVYPFTFSSKRAKGYVSYEQWIKNYKPLFKRIIDPVCAQKCIEESEKMIQKIHQNVACAST